MDQSVAYSTLVGHIPNLPRKNITASSSEAAPYRPLKTINNSLSPPLEAAPYRPLKTITPPPPEMGAAPRLLPSGGALKLRAGQTAALSCMGSNIGERQVSEGQIFILVYIFINIFFILYIYFLSNIYLIKKQIQRRKNTLKVFYLSIFPSPSSMCWLFK